MRYCPSHSHGAGCRHPLCLRWEQLTHLYRYHGLNLIPFYFGGCWELPNACRQGIIANILMTIPFGVLYPLLRLLPAQHVPLLALAVGFSTESAQLLTMLLLGSNYRTVDINDTILNTLGVMLGLCSAQVSARSFQQDLQE
ncbi:MAG: hypothetical protein CVU44_12825 [Chloroflexi bacterium HGW-Chloroflexi-6]|nr:MAG: hypothetical protein CVU44_12825 [Chloroflexi bacterium HGW-Chloroflexi-6]